MSLRIKLSIRTAAFLLALATPFSVLAAPIRFNEIMYDPAGPSIGAQWVELYNPGPDTITIAGADQNSPWKFFDSYGGHLVHLIQGSLTIPPGEFLILSSDGDNFLREHRNFNGSVATVFMTLRENCGDFIELRDGNSNIIDEAFFISNLGAAGNGKTLEFDGKNWRESLIDGGTPGAINSVQGILLAPARSPILCPTPSPQASAVIYNSPSSASKIASSEQPITAQITPSPSSPTSAHDPSNVFPVVSEFMPSAGWIELYNEFNSPLDLNGWSIGTNSSAKNYKLHGILQPRNYLVLASSTANLSLKDGGDSIKLFDPSGKQFFIIKYSNPLPAGASAARFGPSDWRITDQPTPGSANILEEDLSASPNTAPVQFFATSENELQNTASANTPDSGANAFRNIIILVISLLAGIAAIVIAVILKRNYI